MVGDTTARAYKCALCAVWSTSFEVYEQHAAGRKHQRKMKASNIQSPIDPIELKVPPNYKSCEPCDNFVLMNNWDEHIRGRRHLSRQKGKALSTALDKTEDSKYDVQIDSEDLDFGIINGTSGTVTASKTIKVVNNGSATIILAEAKLSSSGRGNVFCVDAVHRCQLNRTNSTSVSVKLSARKSDRGLFENRLELYFEIPSQHRRFTITRSIVTRVGSQVDYDQLKATKPYVRRKRIAGFKFNRFIAGVRPAALAKIVWKRKLKEYPIPPALSNITYKFDLELSEKLEMLRESFIPGELGTATYTKHLQTRLWIEEEQASRELHDYDMEDARLIPRGKLYELRVPGLAEKRPSVIVGDQIFVSKPGSEVAYEGFVHQVENRSVVIQFNKRFNCVTGEGHNVRFTLNRLVFRRMHQALCRPDVSDHVNFPSITQELEAIPGASVNAIHPFDGKIASNAPQLRAVASILHMPPGSIPFIVYGPPGTGKTVTIVEAIRQILKKYPDARILACAPSNSAADIIAERLSALGKAALFRMIAPSQSPATVPAEVVQFTRVNEQGIFVCPDQEVLEAFRVVVSTCCSGGVPFGIGVEPGHFSHVFIDEAAQATEPEVMIPIRTMVGPKTNVILSGDIKQLGPIVRSAVARELGHSVSFLERLMSTPLYNEETANGRSMIKLIKNYRSHPAILDFPNEKFYRNELLPLADPAISHCISGKWDGLVKKNFPVIFHGVCGQDEREDPSPSYFNRDEVIIVRDYVKSLLSDNTLNLNPEHIGVITPYRAQVQKIRQLLRPFAGATRVGSVEEYQGQERRVIIISTVRSSQDMVSFDLRHTLGFVANPRRFNVAVTRAQALLIVVGDPYVLALDPLWKEFINYVHIGGGYTGQSIDWDPTEPVDDTIRLDEARRTQGLTELEELIRRTSELDLDGIDEEDAGAFREEE